MYMHINIYIYSGIRCPRAPEGSRERCPNDHCLIAAGTTAIMRSMPTCTISVVYMIK